MKTIKLLRFEELTERTYANFVSSIHNACKGNIKPDCLNYIPSWAALTEPLYMFMLAAFKNVFAQHPDYATYLSKLERAKIAETKNAITNAIEFVKYLNHYVENLEVDSSSIETKATLSTDGLLLLAENLKDDYDDILGNVREAAAITLIHTLDHCFRDTAPPSIWGKEVSLHEYTKQRGIWTPRKKVFKFAIVGPTQSAKTLTVTSLYFLHTVLAYILSDGEIKPYPSINVPPKHSLGAQTQAALKAFFTLYCKVRFTNKITGRNITIEEYWEMLVKNGLTNSHIGSLAVMIRSPAALKNGRLLFHDSIAKGFTPVSYPDEPHHGSNQGGVQDKLHRPLLEDREISQFTIGATCDEQGAINADVWPLIPMVLGVGYYGPSCYDGRDQPFLKGYTPDEATVTDIYQYLNVKGIDCPKNFLSYTKFYKKMSPEDQELYVRIIMQILIAYKMDFPATKVAGLRISNTNDGNKLFIELARKLFPEFTASISFQQFFGDSLYNAQTGQRQTVKSLCKKVENEETCDFTIVLASAGARMGDSFPPSTKFFIDLTVGSQTTIDTVIQGIVAGRPTGYGKKGILVLASPIITELVDVLRRHKYSFAAVSYATGFNPGYRSVVALTNPKKLSYTSILTIPRAAFPEKFKVLERAWPDHGRLVRGAFSADVDSEHNHKTLQWHSLIKRVLDNAFLRGINLPIALWGETPYRKKKVFNLTTDDKDLMKDGLDLGLVSYRWEWPNTSTEGAQYKRISQNRLLAPHFRCSLDQNTICPVCNDNIKNNIVNALSEATQNEQRSLRGGWWRGYVFSKLKTKNRLCCLNHMTLIIESIDVYLTRRVSNHEIELVFGGGVYEPSLIAKNSRFISKNTETDDSNEDVDDSDNYYVDDSDNYVDVDVDVEYPL